MPSQRKTSYWVANSGHEKTRRRKAKTLRGAKFRVAESKQETGRPLVIHYHIFKNAGTSVDEVLRRNFGAGWQEQEFEGKGASRAHRSSIRQYLRSRPEITALSSHTAFLPPPRLAGVSIFPIIFVRHPIDRLRSAYLFERTQNANTVGAKLARAHDFRGYLSGLLEKS